MQIINVKIEEIREEKGISLRELERRTGIDRHYLADLEKMPADEILVSEAIFIAQALGVTIEDLFVAVTLEII
nr:MAG TPA: helix-turn-helix domain protein [Caudoviricetes sp.]